MKLFLLGLVVLPAFIQAQDEASEEGGIYFDAGEVALACSVGTPLAPKLMNALKTCFSEGQEEVPVEAKAWGRAAKECPPGKMGKECRRKQRELKKKCPPVEKIKGIIAENMADDICLLSELGWIDSEGNEIPEVMTADISGLPEEIRASLSEESISACAVEMEAMMREKHAKEHKRCTKAKMYSEDDLAQLREFGLKIASYKCFKKMFNDACAETVKSEIYIYFMELATMNMNGNSTDYQDYPEYPDYYPEYPEYPGNFTDYYPEYSEYPGNFTDYYPEYPEYPGNFTEYPEYPMNQGNPTDNEEYPDYIVIG